MSGAVGGARRRRDDRPAVAGSRLRAGNAARGRAARAPRRSRGDRDPWLSTVPAHGPAARSPRPPGGATDMSGPGGSAAVVVAEPEAAGVRIALVGSPNAGKTTLFNALTGSAARVGNYPGVTVERRCGSLKGARRPVSILDLPGTYALEGETPDEQVVQRVLNGAIPGEPLPDALLIVADATTLRRGLGLVHEALERGLPSLLVLTMIDEVKARGGQLDLPALGRRLGIHVLGVVGNRGVGIEQLKALLEHPESWPRRGPAKHALTAVERFAWVDELCREAGAGTLRRDVRTDRIDRVP